MPSNFPPGYSEDGDAISHGRESAMYHELLPIRAALDKWIIKHRADLYGPEMVELVDKIESDLEQLKDDIDQPL